MSSTARFTTPTAAAEGKLYQYDSDLNRWDLVDMAVAGVPDGSITTAKLAAGAVTTAKLADSQVTPAKIAGAGPRDATTFYRGDGVFAPAPTADFDRVLSALSSTVITARQSTQSFPRFELRADGEMRWGNGATAPGPANTSSILRVDGPFLYTDGHMRVGNRLFLGLVAGAPSIFQSTGAPNGVHVADPGSVYLQRDGGAGTSIWFKESGSGNTGWVSRGSGSGASSSLQTVAFAASITPNPALGEIVLVGTLTGNLTVNNPTVNTPGSMLEFHYQQDGVGGRTVTYGGFFETPTPIDGTAGVRTYQRFRCLTSTLWVEVA